MWLVRARRPPPPTLARWMRNDAGRGVHSIRCARHGGPTQGARCVFHPAVGARYPRSCRGTVRRPWSTTRSWGCSELARGTRRSRSCRCRGWSYATLGCARGLRSSCLMSSTACAGQVAPVVLAIAAARTSTSTSRVMPPTPLSPACSFVRFSGSGSLSTPSASTARIRSASTSALSGQAPTVRSARSVTPVTFEYG